MIRLKVKCALLVCLTLSTELTTGCASAVPRAKTLNWELNLSKGSVAPYSGVLVPEDAYRFYQTDSVLYPKCRERLEASAGQCEECDPLFSPRQLAFFLLGMITGAFAMKSALP